MTLALLLVSALAHNDVEVLNGAGTSNPSKLFWQAMSIITERARIPLHMTYRAVGSSTGQKEFLGDTNNYTALNDFGAGDIPMTLDRYTGVTTHGRTMLHIPFAMGGIAVFHSVPASTIGGQDLDLTGCLLARIFSRDITRWDHPDIIAINPGFTYTGDIKVVHRVRGSSSTAGFTQYLAQKCPASWTLGSGSTIVWPAGTFEGQGSGGMSQYIQDNEGAIGYIDAGHGHDAGLGEIALMNADGNYHTTRTADIGAAGAQALAQIPSVIPADPTADFSAVNLYDLPGPTTWPITMISYFYLNQDITQMDHVTAGLLVYFINFILSPEGQDLAVSKAFVALPTVLLNYNAAALATLQTPAGMPTFTTEASTMPQVGAGPYVISVKRRGNAEVVGTANTALIATLQTGEETLVTAGSLCLRGRCFDMETIQMLGVVGLVIAIVGFLLGFLACVMAACLCCNKPRDTKPRSVEIQARDLNKPSETGVRTDAV